MTEFVASNGLRVSLDEHGGLVWASGSQNGEPKQKITQAFREFFRHERDTELGRWRSKEHPEYVVYPRDDERYGLLVVNEHNPEENEYVSVNMAGETHRQDIMRTVAREWFAAHPKPKPWHDAKPGEVWVLTVEGIDAPCVVEDGLRVTTEGGRGFRNLAKGPPGHLGLNAPVITAGRRIWPEVSNA